MRKRTGSARKLGKNSANDINKAGRVQVPDVDVAAIRTRLDMTQQKFADSFGIPVQTVRHWEQGWRRPDEAARAYLLVISRSPDAVLEALWGDSKPRRP